MGLDQMELNFMAQNNEGGVRSKDYLNRVAEGSGNVDPQGNFSIEVLRAALSSKYGLDLPNVLSERARALGDVTEMSGFICNKSAHWFAIRMINGRFWNLNSMEERPSTISHFKLATEIAGYQSSGYTVFCVRDGLPPPCTTEAQLKQGLPQYWWKEKDLVSGKGKNAATAATDVWRNVGSGMRLDGQSTTSSSNAIEGLTEEEILQMALSASLQQTAAPTPNGKRAVRRFLKSDPVAMVYAYVESQSTGGQGKRLELRAGFPPKDLQNKRKETIQEANLSGESVQCRFA